MFRSMQDEDIPAILAIENEQAFPWSEAMMRDCLAAPYKNIVLEQAGKLVGFAILSIAVDEAEILNIAIAKGCQRQGLGRRLLQHLIEIAQQQGVRKVFLEVRTSNIPALKLYLQQGFKEIGIRKDYYANLMGREDAIILSYAIMRHL